MAFVRAVYQLVSFEERNLNWLRFSYLGLVVLFSYLDTLSLNLDCQ